MADVDHTLEGVMRHKLEQAISDSTQHLVNGVAKDFADYRYRAGQLDGFARALAMIDTAREEMFKGDKKDGK